jgi:DNA primase
MKSIIEAVLTKLNIKHTQSGNEISLLCPFHNDTVPSLNININTGYWACWSCLTAGRSIESFVSRAYKGRININEYITDVDILNAKIDAIYKTSVENIYCFENQTLWDNSIKAEFKTNFIPAIDSKEAMEYLTQRKLTKNTIEHFKLYYGISGKYSNRIIIPYFKKDRIIGFNSRLITVNKSQGKALRYLYSVYKPDFKEYLYGMEESIREPIILVEGPFDLMWMKQLGYRNCVSSLSTTIRPYQLYHLLTFKKIIFLYDNDENKAGENAALLEAEKILEMDHDKDIYIAKLPDFQDPNESSQEVIADCFKKLKRIKLKEDPTFLIPF